MNHTLHQIHSCTQDMTHDWWEIHVGDVLECHVCGRFWRCTGEDLYSSRWSPINKREAERLMKLADQ